MKIPSGNWKEVTIHNPSVDWVKEVIEDAGTTLGSVHFKKRSNGEYRKMSYRLHVKNPSVADAPKGTKVEAPKRICRVCGKSDCNTGPFNVDVAPVKKTDRRDINEKNNQITVLDANKVVRNIAGAVIGRGAWRTVPLENVVRIANRGTKYNIVRDGGKTKVTLSE